MEGFFRARIESKLQAVSGVLGLRWLYGWTQQQTNVESGFDKVPLAPRFGTVTDSTTYLNPAVELNNKEVEVGLYVWMRPRGYVDGQMVYEFTMPDVPADELVPAILYPIFGNFTYGLTLYTLSGSTAVGVYPGDGITLTLGGAVTINYNSSLTIVGGQLGVDLNAVTFDVVTYVVSDEYTRDCCTETRTVTTRTLTLGKNLAGDVVSSVLGDPVEDVTESDFCLRVKCCFAEALVVEAVADPEYTILTDSGYVEFMATPSGGVGPYEYLWTFPGGTTSTEQNPDFTFTTVGLKLVRLAVTDACGCTVYTIVGVAVGEECSCAPECATGDPTAFGVDLENGTGDFAALNGSWTLRSIGDCTFAAYRDGFILSTGPSSPTWPMSATQVDLETGLATGIDEQWQGVPSSPVCCTATAMDVLGSTGTGTPATVVDPQTIEAITCPVCGTVETACCEELVPAVLYAHFTGALAAYGTVELTWDSFIGAWKKTVAPNACNTLNIVISFLCSGGGPDFTLSCPGSGVSSPSTAFTVSGASTTCEPFVWSASGTATGDGCPGSFSVTVDTNP